MCEVFFFFFYCCCCLFFLFSFSKHIYRFDFHRAKLISIPVERCSPGCYTCSSRIESQLQDLGSSLPVMAGLNPV